jgi:hypothetical protein
MEFYQNETKATISAVREKIEDCLGRQEVTEAPKKTLELEVIKLAVRSSIRLQEMNYRTLWRSQPPSQMEEETTNRLSASAMGAQTTF